MTKETNTPEKQEAPETLIDIIIECGKLKTPIENTLNILCMKFPDESRDYLTERLTTPGTEEYIAYQSALDLGEFEVDSALHKAARSGDADASKQLKENQKDKALDQAIKNTFFPGEGS